MLVPGRVAGAVGEHGNLRRRTPAPRRRGLRQRGQQCRAHRFRRAQTGPGVQHRQRGRGGAPVGDRVPQPGRHPKVVLQHHPLDRTARAADRTPARWPAAARPGPDRAAAGRNPGQFRMTDSGMTPSRTILRLAVDVGQEGVQRAGPLPQPGTDPRPVLRRQQPGNRIERKRLLLQFAVDLGDEGDALGLADPVQLGGPRPARRRCRPSSSAATMSV